jgi:cell division protein FtsQ
VLNKKISYADLRYPNGFALRKPTERLRAPEAEVQSFASNDVLLKAKQLVDKKLNQASKAVENRDLKLRKG